MKRKEITGTIAKVGASTFALNGSMTLLNQKTGEALDIDMPSTLAIIRGPSHGLTRCLKRTRSLSLAPLRTCKSCSPTLARASSATRKTVRG